MFHWYTQEDKQLQLIKYMSETFHISRRDTIKAMEAGDRAQESFSRQLKERGAAVIDQVKKEHAFAVVLASRPYQNDALVNHELPEMFAGYGIPVLTADSLPEVNSVDLSKSRLRRREYQILWGQKLLGRNVFEEMIEKGAPKIERAIMAQESILPEKKKYSDWYAKLLANNMLVTVRWWFDHSDLVSAEQVTDMMKHHMMSGTIPTLKGKDI